MAKHLLAFFGVSCDVDPVYVKDYKNNLKCGHIEKEFQSLAIMANTCSFCLKVYGSENDQNEYWLKCTLCLQLFHESCFHSSTA